MAILLALLFVALQAAADVKSTTGNIFFDSNNNSASEAVITTTGLGIGTLTPSTNLHVAGNAYVSGSMGLGTTTPRHSLDLNGTLGFSVQSVSSNTTLSGNTVVLAGNSSGNITLTLPDASTVTGRVYTIKKITNSNTLTVGSGGGNIDGAGTLSLSSSGNGYPYAKVISDGSNWFIVSQSDGVSSQWSPSALGGNLLCWYDPSVSSSLTVVDSKISQMNDLSGHNNHLSQSTADKRPDATSNTIDGRVVITYTAGDDTTGDFLATTGNPFGTRIDDAAVFVVVNILTMTESALFSLSGYDGVNRWQAHCPYNDGGVCFDVGGDSGDVRVSYASGWSANAIRLMGFNNYPTVSSGNNQRIWEDGVEKKGDTTALSVTTLNQIIWGDGMPSANNSDNAAVGEILILNRIVTDTERQKIEGYLAHRWGLEGNLPAAHPYKTSPP